MTANDEIQALGTRLLERLRYQALSRRAVPGAMNISLSEGRAIDADELEMHLRLDIWTEKLQDEEVTLEVAYPETWFQALKLAILPGWARSRWPVRMSRVATSHRFKTIAKFPEFAYQPPPQCGTCVLATMVEKTGDSRW